MNQISIQAKNSIVELIDTAALSAGQIVVIGCSTSEVEGCKIGTNSNFDTAKIITQTIYDELKSRGIFIAGQCCEHLNRALVVSKEYATKEKLEIVNVLPKPHAGGSFATNLYDILDDAVMVEFIKADAGLDIGATMIGMHLKHVAVPVRLENNYIGNAVVYGARSRSKYIGGPRASYEDMSAR